MNAEKDFGLHILNLAHQRVDLLLPSNAAQVVDACGEYHRAVHVANAIIIIVKGAVPTIVPRHDLGYAMTADEYRLYSAIDEVVVQIYADILVRVDGDLLPKCRRSEQEDLDPIVTHETASCSLGV